MDRRGYCHGTEGGIAMGLGCCHGPGGAAMGGGLRNITSVHVLRTINSAAFLLGF